MKPVEPVTRTCLLLLALRYSNQADWVMYEGWCDTILWMSEMRQVPGLKDWKLGGPRVGWAWGYIYSEQLRGRDDGRNQSYSQAPPLLNVGIDSCIHSFPRVDSLNFHVYRLDYAQSGKHPCYWFVSIQQ